MTLGAQGVARARIQWLARGRCSPCTARLPGRDLRPAGEAFNATSESLYRRIAGNRLMQRLALNRYRRSGLARHRCPSLSTNATLPMRDIYVPLTATAPDGTAGAQNVIAPLDDQLRTVVTGDPGAGSPSPRHAMLTGE